MAKYWFARRYPLTEVRNTRMAPVTSEGWAVVAFFAGCLVAGGVGMFLFSLVYRQPAIGIGTMIVFAIVGSATFIGLAYAKGDKQHTVDDYKAGRVRG